jgi:hypothetical protein
MAKMNTGGDGGKRWPQDSKKTPVPEDYTVITGDAKMDVVAEVVRLLDDGTLVLERDKRANLFAPGAWKILLMQQHD